MIKPIAHTVLIQLDDPTEADEAFRRAKELGIELALDKREHKAVEYGIVMKVGPRAFLDFGLTNDAVKEGDRVTLVKYSGKEVTDTDGMKYVLVNDQDILAIIE